RSSIRFATAPISLSRLSGRSPFAAIASTATRDICATTKLKRDKGLCGFARLCRFAIGFVSRKDAKTRRDAKFMNNDYRRIFAYIAPYWRRLALVFALSMVSTLLGLAQPYITKLLIDEALLQRNMRALAT